MERQQYIIYKGDFRPPKNSYWKILPGESPEKITFEEYEQASKSEEKYTTRSDYYHIHFKIPCKSNY